MICQAAVWNSNLRWLLAPIASNCDTKSYPATSSWRYQPPRDHTVGWAAIGKGRLAAGEVAKSGEMIVFAPSNDAINFAAETDAEFVLGSAAQHPHDLALGHYSVHTSPSSLQKGDRQIADIEARLRQEGRL